MAKASFSFRSSQDSRTATNPTRRSGDSASPPAFEEQAVGSPTHSAEHDAAAQSPPPPARRGSDDLPLAVQDAIFQHQMAQAQPLSITSWTLLAAGVCGWEKDAAKLHHALAKAGVLQNSREASAAAAATAAVHAQGDRDRGKNGYVQSLLSHLGTAKTTRCEAAAADDSPAEYLPATGRITAALPKQLGVLGVPAVKLLIKVLFFWEEEVQRWNARGRDVAALRTALAGYRAERAALDDGEERSASMDEEELKDEKTRLETLAKEVEFRIQAVLLRRRVKPSERQAEVHLPRYEPR